MGSRGEKDKQKQIQDKCQAVLNAMLRDEDNKYCVDCDSKGPRWASWNLGVFLCIRCAGIHRNLGVHISKVKSVNLDSWTPEQVVSLQQMGNSRARAVYEANLPDNFRRPQSDSSLESFIRAKYEHKKYIAREWVPPVIPKVDWEKEIDEEIERQKRKKKTTTNTIVDKKNIKMAEVPQIPKPKSSASPKPARSIVPIEKTTQDLLGLQNGEDGFSGFLSAASKDEPKKDDAADAAKAEEERFFNQPAPSEKEKSKLTKDSILALYGSAPQQSVYNPTFQPQAPVYPQNYQFQAQGYAQPYPQQAYAMPMQNGLAQFQQFGATQGQFSTPMQFPVNPAQTVQMTQPPQFANQFTGAAGIPAQFPVQPTQYVAPQAPFQPFPGMQSAPNPFCPPGAPGSLPQQFAGMSLGAQIPPAKTLPPTQVTTNLWQ